MTSHLGFQKFECRFRALRGQEMEKTHRNGANYVTNSGALDLPHSFDFLQGLSALLSILVVHVE